MRPWSDVRLDREGRYLADHRGLERDLRDGLEQRRDLSLCGGDVAACQLELGGPEGRLPALVREQRVRIQAGACPCLERSRSLDVAAHDGDPVRRRR